MRASRLLSILMLLQTRGRMSARALADEFEISVRTLYRDIDQLSAAGVPVYAERGRMGGFQLMDGYRTRLTGLTAAEAEAMFLSGLPGPAAELGLGEAMAGAQLKLLAALPARAGAGKVAARFHLDPVAWYRAPERTDILPALAQAVWDERRIHIRYESWTGVVDRRLDPLGLVLKAGVWYLVAAAGGRPRTYKVSAIHALELAEEGFERPAGFDLAAYWSGWAADFESRMHVGEARLRVSTAGLARLAALGPAIGEARVEAGAGDWTLVRVPIESTLAAARQLISLGPDAEVLAPADLRATMAELVGQLAAVYVNPTADPRGDQASGRA
jgi:predicted DNA-binding transcriptional regulator YafY